MKKYLLLIVIGIVLLASSLALSQEDPLAYYKQAKINWRAFEGHNFYHWAQ